MQQPWPCLPLRASEGDRGGYSLLLLPFTLVFFSSLFLSLAARAEWLITIIIYTCTNPPMVHSALSLLRIEIRPLSGSGHVLSVHPRPYQHCRTTLGRTLGVHHPSLGPQISHGTSVRQRGSFSHLASSIFYGITNLHAPKHPFRTPSTSSPFP